MIPSIFLTKEEAIRQEIKCGNAYTYTFDFDKLAEQAWDTGVYYAKKYKVASINELINKNNILVEIDERSFNSNYTILSSYRIMENKIILFKRNITEVFLQLVPQEFGQWKDEYQAKELFLCHEFFHYLQHSVPAINEKLGAKVIKLGPFKVKRQSPVQSEIAAHAFVKEFFYLYKV